MFSIIIPSWNNLDHLKLCIESIQKNSAHTHQIIVHINEGSDGTVDYITENNITHTRSDKNIGICLAVNKAAALAKGDHIVYMNDDMYVCPDWDRHILAEIEKLTDDNFMFSGTLIEPKDTGNPCVIHKDHGDSLSSFREEELLKKFATYPMQDWHGSAWPPTIVSKAMWHLVGGYSIEFSPGMSSDDDLAMKMWQAGCRVFKGISKSRIYHFQARSTQRIVKNDGRKQFLQKWGINQSTFNKFYIKRGAPYAGVLNGPDETIMKKEVRRARLKTIWHNIK